MTPERHQQIKEIFLAALDQPADRVAAFLEDHCKGDADLRHEVEVLTSHQAADLRIGVEELTDVRVGRA